jgi:hypothetical protein
MPDWIDVFSAITSVNMLIISFTPALVNFSISSRLENLKIFIFMHCFINQPLLGLIGSSCACLHELEFDGCYLKSSSLSLSREQTLSLFQTIEHIRFKGNISTILLFYTELKFSCIKSLSLIFDEPEYDVLFHEELHISYIFDLHLINLMEIISS